jgi:outer membrane immunogenic protein
MNSLKKTLLLGLLFASPICAASAADLPRKAPPVPVAPPPTWTGYYVGVNAGGVWSNTDIDWSLNPVGFGPTGVLVEQAASGGLKTFHRRRPNWSQQAV